MLKTLPQSPYKTYTIMSSGVLDVQNASSTHFHLRPFALTIPSPWTTFPSDVCMGYSLILFRPLLKCHLLRGTFADTLCNKQPPLPSHPFQ